MKNETNNKPHKKYIIYSAVALAIILACFVVSHYIVQLLWISGESMTPTYHSSQIVVINKTDKDFERDDVIAFNSESLNLTIVKRIIGLPGDTVQIKNSAIYINGEPYNGTLSHLQISNPGLAAEPIELKNGSYFVLGDNLEESKDSRYEEVGLVSFHDILGKIAPNKKYDE